MFRALSNRKNHLLFERSGRERYGAKSAMTKYWRVSNDVFQRANKILIQFLKNAYNNILYITNINCEEWLEIKDFILKDILRFRL